MAKCLVIVIRTFLGLVLALLGILVVMVTLPILSLQGATLMMQIVVLSIGFAVAAVLLFGAWKLLSTTLQLPVAT